LFNAKMSDFSAVS